MCVAPFSWPLSVPPGLGLWTHRRPLLSGSQSCWVHGMGLSRAGPQAQHPCFTDGSGMVFQKDRQNRVPAEMGAG